MNTAAPLALDAGGGNPEQTTEGVRQCDVAKALSRKNRYDEDGYPTSCLPRSARNLTSDRLAVRSWSGNTLEHDDWDYPVRFLLVLCKSGGTSFDDLEESVAVLALSHDRSSVVNVPAQFHSYRRVRAQVMEPRRVAWCSPLGRHNED